jgi:hypothetical protein
LPGIPRGEEENEVIAGKLTFTFISDALNRTQGASISFFLPSVSPIYLTHTTHFHQINRPGFPEKKA